MGNVYVYCPRKSGGAFELVKALGAIRLRKFDGESFWERGKPTQLKSDSAVICWGAHLPSLDGVKVFNSLETRINKFQEIQKFQAAGISTIQAGENAGAPTGSYIAAGWLARKFDHVGGDDLLLGSKKIDADYWVKKDTFTQEIRIHSFMGRSIRAGEKVIRDGFKLADSVSSWRPNANLAHPWIRSFDGGWRINYDSFKSTAAQRKIAHTAVKVLGLMFGAVDIAYSSNYGSWLVLEVNSAPGLEGNTTTAYIKSFQRLLSGDLEKPESDA